MRCLVPYGPLWRWHCRAFHGYFFQIFSILMLYISSTSVVCSSLLLRLYGEPRFNNQATVTVSELATTERNHTDGRPWNRTMSLGVRHLSSSSFCIAMPHYMFRFQNSRSQFPSFSPWCLPRIRVVSFVLFCSVCSVCAHYALRFGNHALQTKLSWHGYGVRR